MNYSLSITKIIFIIIIISLFGLNILNYINKSTHSVINKTSGVVDNTMKGTKVGLGVASGVLNDLEKELDIGIVEKSPKKSISGYQKDIPELPQKSGYCYIGSEKGFRSCIYSGRDDICMSGDIFPTIDVCINPKLRA